MRYPEEARKRNVQGEVIVQFTVNADSTLANMHVVSGIGAGCDEEAIRLVMNGPKWAPAFSLGKPVESVVYYKIFFKIKN